MPVVKRQEDIESLSRESGAFYEYSFSNPDSINGPFGKFSLYTGDNLITGGNLEITTLFGIGTSIELVFVAEFKFDANTGYTAIRGQGIGHINQFSHEPKAFVTTVKILLDAGMQDGSITVDDFFEGLPCQVVKAVNADF